MRNRTIAWAVLCLALAGCTIETHDDDGCGNGGDPGAAGSANDDASGGNAGDDGSGATLPEPPCDDESDCAPGFNCDVALGVCKPSGQETCRELETEAQCGARADCEPIYAGVNCSCGLDCECVGGEPGCICERFDFYECADAAD